jgi:hypothetical protein
MISYMKVAEKIKYVSHILSYMVITNRNIREKVLELRSKRLVFQVK